MNDSAVFSVHQLQDILRVYHLFIVRKVMKTGILKQTPVRIGIVVIALLFMCMAGSFSWYVLKDFGDSTMTFILDCYGTVAVSVAMIVLMVVKLIFSRSGQLLEMTAQMPVSKKQRSLAQAVFELFMVFAGFTLVFAPYAVALVVHSGLESMLEVLAGTVFPGMVAYLLFASLVTFVQRILQAPLRRCVPVALEVLMVVMFFAVERWQLYAIRVISDDYLDGTHRFVPSRIFMTVLDKHGGWAATLAFVVVLVALCALYAVLIPPAEITQSRYVGFPKLFSRCGKCTLVHAYLLRSFRAMETALAAVLAVGLFAVLLRYRVTEPTYACDIMICSSLYAYVDTGSLRVLDIHARAATLADAARHYALIVMAQSAPALALWSGFAVCDGVVSRGFDAVACLKSLVFVIAGTCILVLVGILFPPIKDNPFSVGISVVVSVALVALVLVAVIGLRLPAWSLGLMGTAGVAACIFFSVYGMYVNERNIRYDD